VTTRFDVDFSFQAHDQQNLDRFCTRYKILIFYHVHRESLRPGWADLRCQSPFFPHRTSARVTNLPCSPWTCTPTIILLGQQHKGLPLCPFGSFLSVRGFAASVYRLSIARSLWICVAREVWLSGLVVVFMDNLEMIYLEDGWPSYNRSIRPHPRPWYVCVHPGRSIATNLYLWKMCMMILFMCSKKYLM
jgi:hypothetical protein